MNYSANLLLFYLLIAAFTCKISANVKHADSINDVEEAEELWQEEPTGVIKSCLSKDLEEEVSF